MRILWDRKNKTLPSRLFFSVGRCDFKTMTFTSCLHQMLKLAFGVFVLVPPGLRLWKPPPLYTEQLHPKKREAGNFRVWLKRIQEYEWFPLTTLRIHLLGLGVPPSLQQCYKSMGIFCTVFWALGRERRELLCRDKGPPLCCAVSGKLYHPFVSRG